MKVEDLSKVTIVKNDGEYKLKVAYKKRYPTLEIIGFVIIILFIIDVEFGIDIFSIIKKWW